MSGLCPDYVRPHLRTPVDFLEIGIRYQNATKCNQDATTCNQNATKCNQNATTLHQHATKYYQNATKYVQNAAKNKLLLTHEQRQDLLFELLHGAVAHGLHLIAIFGKFRVLQKSIFAKIRKCSGNH